MLQISDGHTKVLLTGDISAKVERQLIDLQMNSLEIGLMNEQVKNKTSEEVINNLSSTILIAPHHGSKTSSSLAFLQIVDPQIAIFSAGYLNRWNMPVFSVVERYKEQKIKTLNTAESGMIRININEKIMNLVEYRKDLWPYWFAN